MQRRWFVVPLCLDDKKIISLNTVNACLRYNLLLSSSATQLPGALRQGFFPALLTAVATPL